MHDNLPKTVFPSLLYKLVSRLKGCNLVSGFRASGIYPLDRQQVLKLLPSVITLEERVDSEILSESVFQVLQKTVELEWKRSEFKKDEVEKLLRVKG